MTSLTGEHVAPGMAGLPVASGDVAGRSHRNVFCSTALVGADILVVGLVMLLAALPLGGLRHAGGGLARPVGPLSGALLSPDLIVLFAALIFYLGLKGRYSARTPFWTETQLVVCATLCTASAAALRVLSHEVTDATSIIALIGFAALAPIGGRLAKQGLAGLGFWTLPVLVVGNGPSAADAELALRSDTSLGYRFMGRIDPAALDAAAEIGPAATRLATLLGRHRAEKLLIAVDDDGARQRRIVERALRERIPFAVVLAPHAFPAFRCEPTQIFSHNTVFFSFREHLSSPALRSAKVAFDLLVAGTLLILLCPLILGIALACRLDGGPAFFAHRRIGARGRPFRCLKFRTMVVGAEQVLRDALARDPALAAEWAATQKLVHDPRVTRVGRLLRRTSLDELPQLLNVLRLEMSLVGPRPIVDSEVPLYGEHIAHYYFVKPGVTGLWQVSGRNNTTYERRVQLDVWYVNNWSIWHDVAVLLKTVPAVLGRHGAY